jgi:fructose transport system permease protein
MQNETTGQIESNRFEQALPAEDPTVAVFEEEGRGPIRRIQHFLHAYPTMIPFIILVPAC